MISARRRLYLEAVTDWSAPFEVAARIGDTPPPDIRVVKSVLGHLRAIGLVEYGAPNGTYRITDDGRAVLAKEDEKSKAAVALRQHWADLCDADPVPDGFIEAVEAAGLVTFRSVTKYDLNDSFAAERGIEKGGSIWVLTKAGLAALAKKDQPQ